MPELSHETCKAALVDLLAVFQKPENAAKLAAAAAPQENPLRRMHKIDMAERELFLEALSKYGFNTTAEAFKGVTQIWYAPSRAGAQGRAGGQAGRAVLSVCKEQSDVRRFARTPAPMTAVL